jgi:hypothetical protein
MSGRATRTAATLLAVLGCGAALSGQQAPQPPVVAVVLTDGKLLPLAARPSGDWQLLPWPRHGIQESQPALPVPANAAAIPKNWFTPLAALPSTWRLQPLNGKSTTIHAVSPTRWQIATFDAIGLTTDYLDPDPQKRSFDFNAGIAVAGDVDTLPVQELDEASPEWSRLVARHGKSFAGADRADARRRGLHFKGRSAATIANELRSADVSLYRIEIDSKHWFEYFEAVVPRPHDAGTQGLKCPAPTVEYHGLIEQHGRTQTVRWLSSGGLTCDDTTEATEVIGALHGAEGVRFVVEYGGEDRQSFAVVNPATGEAGMRRGARQTAAPSGHEDGEPLAGRPFPR